jgi:histidinol-phosphate aminotransferase
MLDLLPQYSKAAGLGRVKWIASSNESTVAPSAAVQSAIAKAAAHGNRYPSLFGAELIAAISRRLNVSDDQVVVGAGSLALLQQALLAYTGPGTEVVYAWRSYEAYPMLVTLAGATSVCVPLDADHRHDGAALIRAIGPDCRALIICNPNNPTGTLLAPHEIEAILRAVPSEVLVILDEAYWEFTGIDSDAVHLLPDYQNLVIMRTFSKAYGLAGIRAGYLVADAAVAQAIQRTSPPFTLSATASAGALAAWSDEAYTQRIVQTACQDRDRLQGRLRELGVQTPTSGSNFVWMAAPRQALRLEQLCVEEGVAVRAFDGFGIRITAGSTEASDAAVRAVARLVAEIRDPRTL